MTRIIIIGAIVAALFAGGTAVCFVGRQQIAPAIPPSGPVHHHPVLLDP